MSTFAGAIDLLQFAFTPILLLSGLAQMLNVFTTRLGRTAYRVDMLARDSDAFQQRPMLRSRVLDVAVLLQRWLGR